MSFIQLFFVLFIYIFHCFLMLFSDYFCLHYFLITVCLHYLIHIYIILKVRHLFQNYLIKLLIGVIKRKTSLHRVFNHKYTFLYFSIQNNTIYSHVKQVYKIHKYTTYTHEENLHIRQS